MKIVESSGASEACWRLLSFNMSVCLPPVLSLPVHLEHGQRVLFTAEEARIVAQRPPPKTPLTEWFCVNAHLAAHEERLLYHEMVNQELHMGTTQKAMEETSATAISQFPQIARIHTVHPNTGELFYYLRLLLHNHHCRGKKSFADLKLFDDGLIVPTFKEACVKLGLLLHDGEWHAALRDAAITCTGPQLRAMYVIILEFCTSEDPVALFNEHYMDMGDDFTHKHPRATNDEVRAMVALDIERRLQEKEKSLHDFNIQAIAPANDVRLHVQEMDAELQIGTLPTLLREYAAYNHEQEQTYFARNYPLLQPTQKAFVDDALEGTSMAFFLDAIGGAGKTFCENIILSKIRGEGKIAIAVATSGIAATLLSGGRTAQGQLKLPILYSEGCTWNVAAQSAQADLFRAADIFIWDEATMAHRFLHEAFDQGLRDIMQLDVPFGGKKVISPATFAKLCPSSLSKTRRK